jgi:hypothetical protein
MKRLLTLITLFGMTLSALAQTVKTEAIVAAADAVQLVKADPNISLFQAKYWPIWMVIVLLGGRLAWKKKFVLQNFYLLYKSYRSGNEFIPLQDPLEPEPTTGGFASGMQAYAKLTPKAKLPVGWIVLFVLLIGAGFILYPLVIEYFHAVAQSNLNAQIAIPVK